MKKCKLLIAGVVCGAFVMQTGLTGVYASEQSTICYEARQNLNISAKADTNKINVGGKVTLTGTAVGGTAPYTYSYLVHNKDTKRLGTSYTRVCKECKLYMDSRKCWKQRDFL